MEDCPVTDTLGFPEMIWMLRDLFRRAQSKHWKRETGTIEGHEFHSARNNGWVVVYYSYDYNGQLFGGNFRRWLLIDTSDRDAVAMKAQGLFPHGSSVAIRVNPEAPDVSIVVAGDN